jgi:cephalosporin-C deacetylase
MHHFDPAYGYDLDALLEVDSPTCPNDFAHFWKRCFAQTITVKPLPKISHTGAQVGQFELYELSFTSTNNITLYGWVLLPVEQAVKRVMVVGHGYGGSDVPDGNVPLLDCAYVYLCYRGLAKSRMEGIPADPNYHVLFNIDDKDQYILRGCVEDTWMAVSAAQALFPWAKSHIGFMGISFSGGIGALAMPWDPRIKMAHLQVPSFGNQPLRMMLPTWGSANSVQQFHKKHPEVLDVLAYYDAATGAEFITKPIHVAPALHDPVVAPPGQFAIYNNLAEDLRQLFVLTNGHMDYEQQQQEQAALLRELSSFFTDL